MYDLKTILLAKRFRRNLDITHLTVADIAMLEIIKNKTASNPVRDATISNGIATFGGVVASSPLVSLLLNIPVTQSGSGTPSPDNIRDIVGVSGVNISRTGKNLFDINSDKITGAYISSTGAIVYQAGQDIYTEKIKIKPSTQYTISGKSDTNTIIRIALYSANNSFIGRVLTTSMKNPVITITPTSQASYFVINPDNTITDIQVEEGQQATAYEPFGNTYPITFGQTICQGSIDWKRGVVVGSFIVAKLSDFSWSKHSTYKSFYCNVSNKKQGGDVLYISNLNFIAGSWSTGTIMNNPINSIGMNYSNSNLYVNVGDISADDFDNNYGDGQIAYELATPIEVQLTPTQITTLIGENVIFADVANVTECKYTRK